jgi:putative transcriptional regulator
VRKPITKHKITRKRGSVAGGPKRSKLRTGRRTGAKARAVDDDSLDTVILETAKGMYEVGLMDRAGYDKITVRHLRSNPLVGKLRIISGPQIRRMREQAQMSQGVFAQVLNITPGYVSQLERGDKKPKGSTLKLLSVIKQKGIGPLL